MAVSASARSGASYEYSPEANAVAGETYTTHALAEIGIATVAVVWIET